MSVRALATSFILLKAASPMKHLKLLSGCFSFHATNANALVEAPSVVSNSDDLRNIQLQQREQHVIVMRHGDRMDHALPGWVLEAKRPWDPPLLKKGKGRAFSTGKILKSNIPVPIHRVIVSPFIRCVETASEVVVAFCAPDNASNMPNANNHPSMIKISIEYGLCEMLNGEAIRPNLAPKRGNFTFNISDLEAHFPAGTVDRTVEPVYQKLPRWEESVMDARARYELVIRALSDRYPSENLLIVTHGEGVRVAVSAFLEDTVVHEVENCAYAHLKRQICCRSRQIVTAEKFEVITKNGQSGIHFCPLSDVTLDV